MRPQPNSPPDYFFRAEEPSKKTTLIPKLAATQGLSPTEYRKNNAIKNNGISIAGASTYAILPEAFLKVGLESSSTGSSLPAYTWQTHGRHMAYTW